MFSSLSHPLSPLFLDSVPESLQKKAKRDAALKAAAATALLAAKKERRASRSIAFKNAAKYYKEYAAVSKQ